MEGAFGGGARSRAGLEAPFEKIDGGDDCDAEQGHDPGGAGEKIGAGHERDSTNQRHV